MDMFNSQKFTAPEKTDTYGMAFLNNSDILASLVSSDPTTVSPTNYSSVVLMKPFTTTSYLSNHLFDPSRHYLSIDNLNESQNSVDHMILHSIESNQINWLLKNSVLPLPVMCSSFATIRIDPIDNVNTMTYQDPLYAPSQSTTPDSPKNSIFVQRSLNTFCQ